MMATMTYHRFGRTQLQLSRVGLGAGGPSRLGTVRGSGDDEVEALIACARELGINHIDTARGYGTEPAIGRALRRLGAHDMKVATKTSWHQRGEDKPDPATRDPRELVDEIDASLRDLQRDHIDIFQFHAVLPDDLNDTIERLLPVALQLKKQGKIGHIGITEDPSVDHRQLTARAAARSGDFDTLMVQYSILDQVADVAGVANPNSSPGTAPDSRSDSRSDSAVAPATVEASMLDAGSGSTFDLMRRQDMGVFCMSAARSAFTDLAALRQTLGRLGEDEAEDFEAQLPDGMTPAEVAFRFAADQSGIDVVLVGTGRPAHLRASTAAILAEPLPEQLLIWLRQRYARADGQLLWKD